MEYEFTTIQLEKSLRQLYFQEIEEIEEIEEKGTLHSLIIKDNDDIKSYLNSDELDMYSYYYEYEDCWTLSKPQAIKVWNDLIRLGATKFNMDLHGDLELLEQN